MEEITIDGTKQTNEPPKKEGLFRKHLPKWVWITILVVLLVAGLGFAYWIYKSNFFASPVEVAKNSPSPSQNVNDTPCPLDGVMTTKEKADRRPLGIMIENHPDARPQSGLDKASFVIETPTEGGITRFLAYFVENDVAEVGPVRSARTYYVDWADETKAIYAHCGGSAPAIDKLGSDQYVCDINQFTFGKFFWRDDKKYAPHNLYTSTDKVRQAAESKKCALLADYEGYKFKEDAPKEEHGTSQTVTVNFSSAQFLVVYNYDSGKNVYLRDQVGAPHKDKNSGDQIFAKTVVVMYVERAASPADGTQQTHITALGSGKAEVYMDGKKIQAEWRRATQKDRTRYYDSTGKEIEFDRGPIWVEVLSGTMTSTPT